jgi:hypothetical protein
MGTKRVKVWFDREGDYLEVIFEPDTAGYFRATGDDRVMERVDADGRLTGFAILNVSSLQSATPVDVVLPAVRSEP